MAGAECFNDKSDELIITSGAQQAVELACKVLCNEGDTIVCESPSFIGSLNSFRATGVRLAGVEQEEDGIKLDMLEKTLKENPDAKLIYVIPNFQNPTGRTMSWEKRKGVYALAKKYDAIILEDNPYGDLRFEGEEIPSIKTLDTDGRVIYAGSFSKILAPGLRVGYAVAQKDIIQKMVVCKQVEDVHSNIWAQAVCERFMAECDLDAHFANLRKIYRDKCRLMLENIQKNFSDKISYTKPQGGLFIWATLPDGCDMQKFCTRAVQEFKVAVVPGNAFVMYDTDKTSSFRMNYSTPTDEQIVKGCEMLGKLSKEMFD
jgi:2-aminoadipate transaminase